MKSREDLVKETYEDIQNRKRNNISKKYCDYWNLAVWVDVSQSEDNFENWITKEVYDY